LTELHRKCDEGVQFWCEAAFFAFQRQKWEIVLEEIACVAVKVNTRLGIDR
jgi:hypothetical protein